MALKIITFNVHKLNHPTKRSSVWREALKLHSDILCIQETHFMAINPPSFHHKNFPHIFTAYASNKQKEVLTAIKDSIAFSLQQLQADPEGRYLILVGIFNNKLYTIVNLYAPNTHQLCFLRKLFCKINMIKKRVLIMETITFW